MKQFTVAVLLFSLLAFPAFCQEADSVRMLLNTDSIYHFGEEGIVYADSLVVAPILIRDPTKALMFALVLPGLGQAYNRKYWKMPIVWGAIGFAGYAIGYNTKAYKAASIDYALEPNDETKFYLEAYRRNMELSYIGLIAVYGLQILEAYVDALLYGWDVNDNLSLRIRPSLQPMMDPASMTGYSCGITCGFKIKGR
jgi:hypothetical protein